MLGPLCFPFGLFSSFFKKKLKIKNKIKIVIETIALVIILEYTAFICFVL